MLQNLFHFFRSPGFWIFFIFLKEIQDPGPHPAAQLFYIDFLSVFVTFCCTQGWDRRVPNGTLDYETSGPRWLPNLLLSCLTEQ